DDATAYCRIWGELPCAGITLSCGDCFARSRSARISWGELRVRTGFRPNTRTGLRGSAGFADHTAAVRKVLLARAKGARRRATRGGLASVASATSAAEFRGVCRVWIVAANTSLDSRARWCNSRRSLLACTERAPSVSAAVTARPTMMTTAVAACDRTREPPCPL